MLKDMFVNAVILIAFIGIVSQVYRNTGLGKNSPLKLRLLLGLINCILGILLVVFSAKLNNNTLVDFRSIAIIFSAVLGGFVPVTITTLGIIIYRVLYYGINNASVLAVGVAITLLLGCGFISGLNIKNSTKWVLSLILSLILNTADFYILITDVKVLLEVLAYFWVGSILLGIASYYYTNYLEESNRLFRTLRDESSRDFLTGLNNVRQFDKVFNKMSESITDSTKFALLFIDIDHFKKVNDTYGHKSGDAVLKELGKILIQSSGREGIVSRNGGEEFSVLLPDCTPDRAIETGERIRKSVENYRFRLPSGKAINVTISVGVSAYPYTTSEPGNMMAQADEALYQAKRTGRNRVTYHAN